MRSARLLFLASVWASVAATGVLIFAMFLGVLGIREAAAATTEKPTSSAPDPKTCRVPPVPSGTAPDKKARQKASAQIDVARSAYIKGDFAVALTALQDAYALDPSIDTLYNLAQACREAGLENEALPLYEEVLKRNPNIEQKKASQNKILELRTRVAAAESARADKAIEEKRLTDAVACLERAAALDPQPSYQRKLGSVRAQIADEEATANFQKGEYVQALIGWDTAYKADARPSFIYHKAEAMQKAGQRREAAVEYERFLKESPEAEQPELRAQATARAMELRKPLPVSTERPPVYKRWWFWTAIAGAVVVATGVGVGLALRPKAPEAPEGVTVFMTSF